jgi:acyl carrier protein
MAEVADNAPVPTAPLTAEEEAALRESLKRCPPATLEAVLAYRRTGDTQYIPTVVLGIIERFVEPDQRPRLKNPDPDLRVIEDLGVDSLTMMEIVLLVEESLKLSIKNEELRNLRTIGDINAFIECKVQGKPAPAGTRFLPIEAIAAVMPMQPPFLFLQEASLNAFSASGRYAVSGSESFLEGHFKDNPVVPASILLEALGQLAVLWLLEGGSAELAQPVDPQAIYFTGCEGVRCHRIVRPGEILNLSVRPRRLKAPLATFEGTLKVGGEKAVFAEEITLTFGFREALSPASPEGAAGPNGTSAPSAPA